MDRKKFLFRKKLRYMSLFTLIFMVVFIAFSLVIYRSSSAALFEEVDMDYRFASEYMRESDPHSIENYLAGRNIVYSGNGSYVINHKIFLLMRDESGALLNADALSSFDYVLNLEFDGKDIGNPRTQAVSRHGESVYYRTYSVPVQTQEASYYIQMITSANETMKALTTIKNVLIRSAVVMFLISLLASWYMGQFLINAVTKTWEQQDEFLSYAAHLIRAPLTVIHNSLELVLQQPNASVMDVSDHILHAVYESSRLRKTTSRLMSMATLQAQEFLLQREELYLDELILNFIDAFEAQAIDSEKEFRYELAPRLKISADRELMSQLCILLLENAIKYTEAGDEIAIKTTQTRGKFTIEVADTGVGISEDALPHVFTRFYREESVKKAKEGSGLGLYIASLIASQHGGEIQAFHNQPRGTRVLVTLPLGKG